MEKHIYYGAGKQPQFITIIEINDYLHLTLTSIKCKYPLEIQIYRKVFLSKAKSDKSFLSQTVVIS